MRPNVFILPLSTNVLFTLITITLAASSTLLILNTAFVYYSLIFINAREEIAEIHSNLYLLSILTLIALPAFFLIFLHSPWRKFQSEAHFPEIVGVLEQLRKEMGIEKKIFPVFINSEQVSARISGVLNYKLVISTPLCKKFSLFPEVVKAILAHELAHVKNGDISKHEIAEAAWKSYTAVAIIYLLVSLQLKHSYVYITKLWELLLFPSISLYALNAYIRKLREFYADARVSDRKSLILALRMLLLPRKRGLREFLIKFHSVPISERLMHLQNAELLLKPKIGFGFILGIISWLMIFDFLSLDRVLIFMEIAGFSRELINSASSALFYSLAIIVVLTSFLVLYIFLSYTLVLMFSKAAMFEGRGNIGMMLRVLAELVKQFIFWAAGFLVIPILHLLPYYLSLADILPRDVMLASILLPFQLREIYTNLIPANHMGLLAIACLEFLPYVFSAALAFFIFQWNSSQLTPKQRIYLPAILTALFALLIYILEMLGSFIALACIFFIFGITLRFARCPSCGKRLIGKITYITYACPFCSYKVYSWLFEQTDKR